MNFLGLTVTRTKAADMVTHLPAASSRVGGGWWGMLQESFAGAWQRNIVVDRADVMTYWAVWSCVTLIASDISKLWIKLVEHDSDGIATEIESAAYSPVLRKPNHFQTMIKFIECWMISKLTNGNTYVLKERDNRGIVVAMYVLDPSRVSVLVASDGSVFYQLGCDYLSGLGESSVTVPARDIIHDLAVPLYHPLVGISPIHACGLAATQGLKIQRQSEKLFASGSQLSGVLTAPGNISEIVAKRLEKHWEENFAGERNVGKVAVLGDGLKFEPMVMTAVDAQLIEQLRLTAEMVCACHHVPGYMVGVGSPPPYTDIQSINLQYYTQALQQPIEHIETLLEEGLNTKPYGIEFDLDALSRMDSRTQMDIATKGVGGGIFSPNEARARFDMKPVKGGATPYLQVQNYSLAALDRRDQAAAALPAQTIPDVPAQTPKSVLDRFKSMVEKKGFEQGIFENQNAA